mmetsp:Transcript_8638/g.11935  ORF Transcript_8638/g.11935 Transcript_8638/m.11935 type:complete len:209 (+) Transcript_8638:103-729(+)
MFPVFNFIRRKKTLPALLVRFLGGEPLKIEKNKLISSRINLFRLGLLPKFQCSTFRYVVSTQVPMSNLRPIIFGIILLHSAFLKFIYRLGCYPSSIHPLPLQLFELDDQIDEIISTVASTILRPRFFVIFHELNVCLELFDTSFFILENTFILKTLPLGSWLFVSLFELNPKAFGSLCLSHTFCCQIRIFELPLTIPWILYPVNRLLP